MHMNKTRERYGAPGLLSVGSNKQLSHNNPVPLLPSF